MQYGLYESESQRLNTLAGVLGFYPMGALAF